MAILLSPGVSTEEIDLTTIVPTVSTTAGGYAGFFRWGPVNKRVLIDSEVTMSKTWQPPDANTAVFYWSAANFLSYGNQLWMVRANTGGLFNATANGAPNVMIPNSDSWFYHNRSGNGGVYGPWFARYPGGLGNSLNVFMCPSAQAFQANLTALYGITANATPGNNQIVLVTNGNVAAPASGNVVIGDFIQVGTSTSTNGYVQITGFQGSTVNTSLGSVSVTGNGLPIIRKWQYASQFTGAPSTSAYANTKSGSNDQMHIIVVDANGSFYGSTTQNYILEKFPYLSKAVDAKNADSSPGYYQTVIFNQSKYLLWADHPSGTTNWGNTAQGTSFTAPVLPIVSDLSGGSDAANPYAYTGFNFIGDTNNDTGLINAYQQFQSTDDVSISLIPTGPASPTVQQWVLDNIVSQRLDCITFFSPRYADVVNQSGSEATNIVSGYLPALNRQSSYAVVDSGWKYQFDKYAQNYTFIPLNGDIAGLCVRTDTIRAPWYSPAGYNRGTIQNITKLAWNPSNVSGTGYRDLLYTNGVNPVVTFKGAGTILFGDKTLQYQPSAFDRINVRRLFIILEQSISTAAKFSLFEFNDNFTRAAFVNMVQPFLSNIKGQRGIQDFFVVCDTTNNTPAVIQANQFVGDIYIKPNYSINFITLHFVAVGQSVDFTTIVGQF